MTGPHLQGQRLEGQGQRLEGQGQRLEGQGQRLEGMLAQLSEQLQGAPTGRGSDPPWVPGWPLAEVVDPLALEVHRPVQPEDEQHGLPLLPTYVPREHDAELGRVVTAGGAGERVAAGLRELLRDPARGPVLVLGALWTSFWDVLTAGPQGGSDPHAQARELLAGQDIRVPTAFTSSQLQRLAQAGDPRLDAAAAGAQDREITQYLAGVPALLARYRNAPPEARALIHQLADYPDQAGRLTRRGQMPPATFWAAAAGYAHAGDLTPLADAAYDRGLYRDAAGFRKRVTAIGDPHAAARLVASLHALDPTDQRPACWAAIHAALDDPRAVANLLTVLREADAGEQVVMLLARDPAAPVALNSWLTVGRLVDSLREADAPQQAEALIGRLPGGGMFETFLQQVDHWERFRFGREIDGRPAPPWSWDDLN